VDLYNLYRETQNKNYIDLQKSGVSEEPCIVLNGEGLKHAVSVAVNLYILIVWAMTHFDLVRYYEGFGGTHCLKKTKHSDNTFHRSRNHLTSLH
jgi:hypothetical protein